jgi:hypothetical protein
MRCLPVLVAIVLAAGPSAAQQTPADSARVCELHDVEVLPRPRNVADFAAALRDQYPAHPRDAGVGGTVQIPINYAVGGAGVSQPGGPMLSRPGEPWAPRPMIRMTQTIGSAVPRT